MPLNRATAALAGLTISLFGAQPLVNGDLVTVTGFTARIVTECTSLYPILLYAAFVFANPAPWRRCVIGIVTGALVLTAMNLLRIALVTVVGAKHPLLFEVLHVYLGQVVMLLLVVFCCLVWNSRAKGGWAAVVGFIVRCLAWGSLMAIPWIMLNVLYVKALDVIVARIFALANYQLVLSYQHVIYYQTFNTVLLAALLFSERRLTPLRRSAWLVGGMLLLAAFHLIFRVGNVLMTAFGQQQLLVETTIITVLGSYLLPTGVWLAAAWFGTGKREIAG